MIRSQNTIKIQEEEGNECTGEGKLQGIWFPLSLTGKKVFE
jgi:hypothetical protein